MAGLEAKAVPGKNSLAVLFEKTNRLEMQLKLEKIENIKISNDESLLSTEMNPTTSSGEGEEYFVTSPKLFRTSKSKLSKQLILLQSKQ